MPKETAQSLSVVSQEWPQRDAGHWRWVAPRLYHLTLAFLGQRPEEEVAGMLEAGKAAASSVDSFQLSCRGLGFFPRGRKPPRVLWAGMAPSAPLEGLAADLGRELQHLGIGVESQPFRAHITLARRRPGRERSAALPERLCTTDWGAWTVAELILMESQPGSGPPLYGRRACWKLRQRQR